MARDERIAFLGLRFDPIGEDDAIHEIMDLVSAPGFSYVVTPNVDHVVQLHRRPADDRLWIAYERSALCLCDSRILQALARVDGLDLPAVPGSDLTARLLHEHAASLRTISVIGGTAHMVEELRRRFPSLAWRHHCPPMGVSANPSAQQRIVEFIEQEASDICFLAIGAPQSELICSLVADGGAGRGAALCIGASLEFLTGIKRRAPRWMQRSRLEWLFRLLAEPRRLARRYLIEGPRIVTIWSRWRRHRSRGGCDSSRFGGR